MAPAGWFSSLSFIKSPAFLQSSFCNRSWLGKVQFLSNLKGEIKKQNRLKTLPMIPHIFMPNDSKARGCSERRKSNICDIERGEAKKCGTLSEDDTADPLPMAWNCFSISDEIKGSWESRGASQRQLLELGWPKSVAQCRLPVWGAGRSEDRVNTRVLASGSWTRVQNGLFNFIPHPNHPSNGLSELLQPWFSAPVLAVSPPLLQARASLNVPHHLPRVFRNLPRTDWWCIWGPFLDLYLAFIFRPERESSSSVLAWNSESPGWRWCWEGAVPGEDSCTLGSALSQLASRPGVGSQRRFSSVSA